MPSPRLRQRNDLLKIREAHKLYDIYSVLGLPSNKRWIVCPLPDHAHYSNTPSFSIFWAPDGVQRFKCHGNCGHQGDVIDLAGYLHVPGYREDDIEYIRRAIAALGIEYEMDPPQPPARTTSLPPDKYRQYLPPGREVIEYAQTRGLTPETLEHFYVGQHDHFMAMPAFEEGQLIGIKFRNTWPRELLDERDLDHSRFWMARGSRKGLFNYDGVAYTEDPVLVVKGEIPVMLLHQNGFTACAPTGGEGAKVEEYALILSFSRRKVVVGDNDPDPDVRAKMQAAAEARAVVLDADLHYPPEQFKDIDEYLLAEPIEALIAIEGWLS